MKLDLLLGSFISIVSNRTILPRKMLLFNILPWQLIFLNITTMEPVIGKSGGSYHIRIPVYLAEKE